MLARVRRAAGAASLAARGVRAAWIAVSRRAHPIVDGQLRVDGLAGPVEVVRDRFGVPHVYARDERDACFGQGFVHAQDRLFQMDSLRRAAAGRLSEWAGERGLEADRFLRRLGFADIAARDLAAARPLDRELVLAYARGVNAGIATLRALPPEYALIGAKPEPWHPEHSFLVGRFVLFVYSANWDTELLRERLLYAIGPERAAAVDPTYPPQGHTATGVPHVPAGSRLLDAYRAAVSIGGMPTAAASNAWAVTAERTATGAPLLTSDPHLDPRLPGLLHVSHVSGGRFDVIGAGVAGVPLVSMGHNGHVAWGITAGLADVSDCYVEEVDPDTPARYRAPEGWVTGRTRIERIAVRGGGVVEEHVLETRHGPVIGPALAGEQRAVALRSTALEPGDPLGPVLDLCAARCYEEFDEAVGRRPGAPFNYVFATRSGEIGYRMSGSIPQRAHGEGLLPADGPASAGSPPPLNPDQMPHRRGSPDGALISANQAPGGEHELGEEWCEPWRAERIATLLAGRERHTIGSFQAMQLDSHSEALVRLRSLLMAVGAISDPEVAALVSAWDGQATSDSAAAAVLELVYAEVARAVTERLAGKHAATALGAGLNAFGTGSFSYRLQGWVLRVLEAAAPPWCDDAADRDRLLRAAAARALARLRGELGPRPGRWRWGALHRWRLPHALAQAPLFGAWFSRGPYAFSGDSNTVLQGGYGVLRGPDPVGMLPGYRQIIDLADFDRSVFQLSTGNSGIPGHPRYGDCIEEFLAGRYRPLLYTRAAVERHAEHHLRLEPA